MHTQSEQQQQQRGTGASGMVLYTDLAEAIPLFLADKYHNPYCRGGSDEKDGRSKKNETRG